MVLSGKVRRCTLSFFCCIKIIHEQYGNISHVAKNWEIYIHKHGPKYIMQYNKKLYLNQLKFIYYNESNPKQKVLQTLHRVLQKLCCCPFNFGEFWLK